MRVVVGRLVEWGAVIEDGEVVDVVAVPDKVDGDRGADVDVRTEVLRASDDDEDSAVVIEASVVGVGVGVGELSEMVLEFEPGSVGVKVVRFMNVVGFMAVSIEDDDVKSGITALDAPP